MVEVSTTTYKGYEVVQVSNNKLALLATISIGPRILKLSAFGSNNLFVELPDAVLEYPGEGDLELVGGHRLWYAPEDPASTYIPDSSPVEWRKIHNGFELIQRVDVPTQIQKSILVALDYELAKVTITHKLTNKGEEVYTLAPWAITQLLPGGVAVLPQKTDNADVNGLLPNRQFVLWPYTNIASDNIELTNNALYVKASLAEGALKIGSPNPEGWIGYSLGGILFVKKADYNEDGDYLDRGASSQIYCNPDFIELETLAPVVTLDPGETASHVEVWEIYPKGSWPANYKSYFE